MKIPTNKIKDIVTFFHGELDSLYTREVVTEFISIALKKLSGLSKTDIHTHTSQAVLESELSNLEKIVYRLKEQEPIQYILEETEFYGLTFKVSPSVLIPRPETEELVEKIIKSQISNLKSQISIVDIGTGSGCIAIALKKNIPQAQITGIDISKEALSLAEENARFNKVDIKWIHADVLGNSILKQLEKFDIIVSNPPYVKLSEKEGMAKNVLDYEPHLALFVDDKDPLIFYRAIAEIAILKLNKKGSLFFEINEQYGEQLLALLKEKGFSEVHLTKDLSGKNRILQAVL